MTERNVAIGDREICAWQTVPGVTVVQTRNPKMARKLETRQDSRLIATGVSGGYLRIFEFEGKTLAWAERLISRYTQNETGAGTGENESNP